MSPEVINKKIELIQWLSSLEDRATIEKLVEFRDSATHDWWSETADGEQESIEKGIADAESNRVTPHSTARKRYEKWL